jgi:8-oxo-dGTP pyrophosphatase MutT (NUDIX family)
MISQRVLCFLERDGRYLLLHRRRAPNAGLWNAIGGKIEPGEDPFAACIREVHEETALTISALALRVLLVVTVRATGDLWVIYVFHAPAPAGDPAASDEGELEWVSAADFSRRRTPADLPLILPHLQGTATGGGVAVIRLEYETETGGPIHTEILGT